MYNSISIKGAKKKPKQPRKPVIAKDSAASMSFFKGDYGTSEGEIYGLVDGGKSIFLEGTPLLDDDGNPNFEGVTWEERKGTLDQEYMKGFPDVSNEVGIGVELKGGTPWVRSITNTQLSALRLRFKWDRLAKTNPDNGDVTGYRIDYAIDLRTDGGAYQEVLSTKIEDKTSAGYERTHRIDLPKSKTGWSVRVRRITPNANSEYISDRMYVDALAEVIDVKLAYPLTAGLGLQYNAELFNGVAKVEFLKRGRILKVPTNYNAETRQYTGIWDGTFKEAYSNNPAWVYYDLLTNKRYGLGHRLDASMIDKWGIYNLARYCDEMVSDGQGGLEPRFTCNVYLQKQATAYEVLQHIAGIFSALSYWNGEKIFLDADIPRDPVFTFTNANVVGGNFSYSGTRDRDRHNIIKVAWDNPANGFKTEYEYVRDEKSIAMNGIKPLDLAAFGCTSQSQAQRLGLRALKTEQLETQQVTFATGLAAINCKIGDVIAISDASLAGKSNGGLISNVAGNVITIDRDAVINIGDTLTVNTAKGLSERRNVTAVNGRQITVAAAFDGAEREHVWSVESSDLKMQLFRVMSVTENDDATYSVLGIQHEPQKFNAIDFGTDVKPTSISIVDDIVITPPESVVIKSRHRVEQGQTVATLIIEWSQVKEAVAYEVEWRKDDGSWIRVPRTGTNSVEIDGVYAGQYLARVRSVGAFDTVSNPTTSMLTEVKGKVGKPPALANLKAVGILFGMELSWSFAPGSKDADYVEIEQGSAPDTNVSLLGQFSYPTDRHEITGLQGGLTRSYRARLVDKLGFKSDWTEWATATVDDSADKVLDLIEGQITESHLYQELTDKIDKVDRIEPLELLVGDETKGLVKAIADEREARIEAIGTSALEDSKSLHERADELAGTVNGITEWQEEVDTDIEKSLTKLTYLASELDFGYADKTQYASKARGTAWTFAKTVARADYVNSELARGISADLANAKASFTEQITANATENLATTQKIENLSAQVVGGYEGNDLGELSSGLLYQESTARASDFSALSEQISLLSAGVGEQFDPYQIWHFDKDSEGWTGGTYNGGYINARTDKLQSPSISRELDDGTIEPLNTSAYHHIKMRLEVVGEPTWSGLVEWSGGSTTITEPVTDEGVANVSFDLKWSGDIDSFTIKIAETADNLNYYKVDWIAVGRPSPGASSAAVLDIKRAFSDYKVSSSEKLTDLTSTIYGNDLTPLTASIREQLNTLATDSGTHADTLTVLDAWYKGEDASMAAITKQQYEALTSADSANARRVDELFAEMDFGYADKTKFANINRSMQRTLATTIAVADWTQNQRIDTLQSEFQGSTSQIQNELLTLASKDLAIASEQTRLSAQVGDNSSDILDLKLVVQHPETGLAAKYSQLSTQMGTVTQQVGTFDSKFSNISGQITTIQNTVNGQKNAIEVVASLGDADKLKYEIAKARLDKDKPILQGKIADLDSLIAKYKAQRTDALAKKAQATDATVIASYDAQIALLNTSIADALTQRSEVVSQVAQLDQEIAELASLKLTESEVKKQYFVKFDSGNRAAGFGIMENANATIDFAVLADKFYIAPPSGTGKGVRPFAVYTSPTTINGAVVPAGTYIDNAFIANGTIDAAKIKDAAITTAKIDNAAITSAKIDDLAVQTAHIGNAQVDTLQIKGQAVTVPEIQFTDGADTERVAGTDLEINRISMDAKGGAVAISFGFERLTASDFGNPVTVVLTLRRGSKILRTFNFGTSGGQVDHRWITVPTYVDKPPLGNQTYTMTMRADGRGESYITTTIYSRSFQVMGVRR